jgi:hypothetical protein
MSKTSIKYAFYVIFNSMTLFIYGCLISKLTSLLNVQELGERDASGRR